MSNATCFYLNSNLQFSRSEPANVFLITSFVPHFASRVGTRSDATIMKTFFWSLRTFPGLLFLFAGAAESPSNKDCISTTAYCSLPLTATAEKKRKKEMIDYRKILFLSKNSTSRQKGEKKCTFLMTANNSFFLLSR